MRLVFASGGTDLGEFSPPHMDGGALLCVGPPWTPLLTAMPGGARGYSGPPTFRPGGACAPPAPPVPAPLVVMMLGEALRRNCLL